MSRPLRAIHFPVIEEFRRAALPGSFHLMARSTPGLSEMLYVCPCGCGRQGRLLIGENHKPGGPRPSWRWNGDREQPTLDPSVNHVDHWHGWLRHGYWEAA